jgi:glucose-6-phosphate 1-dehydrogenase
VTDVFAHQFTNQKKPDPCSFVIFGVTGDLTHRLVIPSLYNLEATGLLPDKFCVVGVARKGMSNDALRDSLMKGLRQFATRPVENAVADRLLQCVTSIEADPRDSASFDALRAQLKELEAARQTGGNRLFYLATPPDAFAPISRELGRTGLLKEQEGGPWRRLVIEKPFGTDLASAKALNAELLKIVEEHQIYRIDHYLGKETAQNLLVFRIGNAIFEPVWNRRYIDHVQLIVAESIGVEGRGTFYETAGAFRDVMQNHMFMLLALIAMEPPTSLEGEAIRNEKVKLLRSIHFSTPEEALTDTVRGQYGEGIVGGKKVSGYRQEPSVNPNSTVETYAAIKLRIDNWRWAGVPFYLRSGKCMPRRTTTIVIRFKTPPLSLFAAHEADPISPNYLIFKIQPEEGIALQVRAKIPGPTISTRSVKLDFGYDQFGDRQPTTGYEKLLYDCMVGDASLFHRSDVVEAAWEAAAPILEAWNNNPPTEFPNYAAGTWGPEAALRLIQRDQHHWFSSDRL